jgi:hypothetical protein
MNSDSDDSMDEGVNIMSVDLDVNLSSNNSDDSDGSQEELHTCYCNHYGGAERHSLRVIENHMNIRYGSLSGLIGPNSPSSSVGPSGSAPRYVGHHSPPPSQFSPNLLPSIQV